MNKLLMITALMRDEWDWAYSWAYFFFTFPLFLFVSDTWGLFVSIFPPQ